MKEFEVTWRIKNNLLVQRRKELGLSLKDLAKMIGVSAETLGEYERLKKSPMQVHRSRISEKNPEGLTGDWRPSALLISKFFSISPEELWPEVVQRVKQSIVVRKMDADLAIALALNGEMTKRMSAPPDEFLKGIQLSRRVTTSLIHLTERQREIVERKYGLNGRVAETLPEIAENAPILVWDEESGEFEVGHGKVSSERVRQLLEKALRRMRHSSISTPLREFYDEV